jgi:Protein of unknown function (DUF3352)
VTDSLASTEPAPIPSSTDPPPPAAVGRRHPRVVVAGVAAALVVAIAVLVVALAGGSGASPPATGAARLVPADALAYVNVSLDRGRPAVGRALALAGRFPDYPLGSAAVLTRFSAIIGGGRAVDFSSQVAPWLGGEAALALLNTQTATAGSLIVLSVTDVGRARAFVRSSGATARGSYRETELLAYPSGSELAFLHGFLVLGQDASVRSAIDVADGAAPSLAGAAPYRRAAATEPTDRVLDAYASLAGVRRVLAPQGGLLGALGDLLYQPALQGVTISLSPTSTGARIQVHSALDPTLTRLSTQATSAFTPTLTKVMPSGSILVLDVAGLDRVAPQVLNAGAAAGVAGGLGPLLSRLGTALAAEGVNVHDLVSIFHGETAVAILPHARAPVLVIVARTANQLRTATELAQLQIPLAQLFRSPNASAASQQNLFNDQQVGGITAHQLALANGLQLDYAVAHGLVIISTSLDGIAAVAQRARTLAAEPAFRSVLGTRPARVTSLVFLDFVRLLSLGEQTGLTSSARFEALRGDLEKIQAVGLSATHTATESSATINMRVP